MSENTMERLPGASGFPATGIDLTTGRTTVARVTVEKLRVPISVAYVLVLVALVLSSASVWEAHSPLVCSSLFCLGIFLAGMGSLGRVWCSLYIGGRKTRTLVCEGPYSLCRNPLYFFSLLGVMGVGFASETLVVPGILVLGFAAYYPFVIRAEENKLRAMHGPQYEQYRRAVPKFFPRLTGLNEPPRYEVDPVRFRRNLVSALWFVWLIGGLEIVETLHAVGWLPVLFRIY